jgi:hypothetical protein
LEYTKYTYVGGYPGYETYIGGDDKTGTIAEKMTDYRIFDDGRTLQYKTTRYDADGKNPVVTNVESNYTLLTVKY